MSLPPPELTVPTLQPYQLNYGGLTFGGYVQGDPYTIVSAEGLFDVPTIATADTKRLMDRGMFPGVDTEEGKTFVVQCVVKTDGVSFAHARRAISGVLGAKGSTEYPLFFATEEGTYCVMARPRKYACPLTNMAIQAQGAVATCQFLATDPTVYSAPTQEYMLSASGGEARGITWPATWPLTWGANAGGLVTITNLGGEECRPVLVLKGPLSRPRVSNYSLPGEPTIEYEADLLEGDELVIDTDWETAQLTSFGGVPTSVRKRISPTSTWWGLQQGPNLIGFHTSTSEATTGSLVIWAASAYSGV